MLTDMAETAKDLERIQEQFENGSLKSSGEAQERLSRRWRGVRRQSMRIRNGERVREELRGCISGTDRANQKGPLMFQ